MQKVANWTDVLSYHTSVPLSQPVLPPPLRRDPSALRMKWLFERRCKLPAECLVPTVLQFSTASHSTVSARPLGSLLGAPAADSPICSRISSADCNHIGQSRGNGNHTRLVRRSGKLSVTISAKRYSTLSVTSSKSLVNHQWSITIHDTVLTVSKWEQTGSYV